MKKRSFITVTIMSVSLLAISGAALASQGAEENLSLPKEISEKLKMNVQSNDYTLQSPKTKEFHAKTLALLNIGMNQSDSSNHKIQSTVNDFEHGLRNMLPVYDKDGQEWIYCSYIQSNFIEREISKKYSPKVETSFIIAIENAMNQSRQAGDTVPIILINKELTKGKIAFLRNKGEGEMITKDFDLDKEANEWYVEN
ncbi:molybdenum cofactor guanylyltransferase MobA [Aneurinibacillus migulanus]|uniref:IseA DL-endopeptidase inhibitor n=1 Tax=Aneurinibacillus migulanus TaxID=47500 RepID=A0A0D1XZT9_ANEMI|nr:molybdenum cofactor guanylyltransferase MobA [Aneurinibacillus migulanus]KIV59776.1 hypothetical protein TS65_02195 [Aneurinibacillus migulanus]KON84178.1 hypothetical protein AF333_29945 [Aneurinibacillus migulanus]MED0890822.1 hypothetical protein [Aneurinibacillus migulanus]MED1618444.1 hypothetical protein [Aneurinibacillus migulanus]